MRNFSEKLTCKSKTRILSLVLTFVIAFSFIFGSHAEQQSFADYTVEYHNVDICGYVNVDEGNVLNVRKGPGTKFESVTKLSAKTMVQILGESLVDGQMWYYIGYATENAEAYGFCSSEYISFVTAQQDPEFEELLDLEGFPESYKVYLRVVHFLHPNWIFELMDPNVTWERDLAAQTKFKESFITLNSPSSWKSLEPDNYNWDTDVYVDFEGTRTNASKELVAFYIDPRNFLNDVQIFQFEKQTYSESLNDVDVINKILEGTFMYQANIPGGDTSKITPTPVVTPTPTPTAVPTPTPTAVPTSTPTETPAASQESEPSVTPSETPDETSGTTTEPTATPTAEPTATPTADPTATPTSEPTPTPVPTPEPTPESNDVTYAEAFIRFGQEFNVSPLMLAARVRQEQGVYGTSKLISGTVPGFEGYYNYFNIGASGNTPEIVVQNGMKEAKSEGWTSHYLALEGGSRKVAENYISKGQDTIYLQKFDLDPAYFDQFWHQYMQNIQAPTYETRNTLKTYKTFGLDDAPLVFKIPILKNMPSVAAPCPTEDGNPNYRLKAITLNGNAVPDFKSGTYTYTMVVDGSVSEVNIQATPVNSKTKITGTGKHRLVVGQNVIEIQTVSERGGSFVGTYKLVINRKEEILPTPTIIPTSTAEPTATPTASPTSPTATPGESDDPNPTYSTTYASGYNEFIDKDIVYGIEVGTTVKQLKDSFKLNNVNLQALNYEGAPANDSDLVTTGTTIILKSAADGKTLTAYHAVIFGDVNNDGKIDEFDFVYIKRDVWEISPLTGINMVAGAISSDDPFKSQDVNEFDFVFIKRHVWEIAPINQNR